MPLTKEEVLKELGLSVNETKSYLALLHIGATTAGKIAEYCKLHRTNVYDSLERLEEKGLVSHILQDNKRIFEATDPAHLTKLIEERQKNLEAVMPQLLLDKNMGKKTSAQIFEGSSAFKLALYNLLKYKKPIYIYGLPKHAAETVKNFIDLFHKERIEQKIPMFHIYNENAKDRIDYLNSLEYTEARYLPSKFDTPVSTITCGAEVMIIHWANPLIFIRIENKVLAETYKNYFDILYEETKKSSS